MKVRIHFHINAVTPEVEMQSEDYALQALQLWLLTELKMPACMVEAVSIESIEEIE